MIAALLAATLLSSPTLAEAGQQSPSPVAAPVDLEEVVVEGNRLQTATENFIREVGAPVRDRGLARWRGGVCVGVINLQNDAAQFIIDRVSDTARDLGLRVGAPGCQPSILVVATADGNAFTPSFVAARPRLFRVGASGMDHGRQALQAFETNGRPVRWWTVSAPVNDDTGLLAVRVRGQVNGDADNGQDGNAVLFAPQIASRAASRLTTQIVDDTKRSFVIVDVSKTSQVSLPQLADYITMVSLAQIDPDGDTSGYATILNLFDDPSQTEGLTNWDRAYLQGLYEATRTLKNPRSSRVEIAASIVHARHQIDAADDASAGREGSAP